MAYRGQGQKVQKVMVQPINLIFRYLQNRSRIQVWLYEQVNMRIEGCIIGFDEYMNLVLDDAEEIHSKTKSRKQLEIWRAGKAWSRAQLLFAIFQEVLREGGGFSVCSTCCLDPEIGSCITKWRGLALTRCTCHSELSIFV
ncbi:small nuclear ribonucleoprotein E isoform X7 [Acinonyx jubatus]|uniref:Small nuclear ribonucleoprotein E n=1 Tax=Acinonyx jubatus TaxID=32536 RepID=A0A6J2AL90_ACIJB|nr:small nuclear ribonucleoprotein E isoform X7 [Acinonyx jubatus]